MSKKQNTRLYAIVGADDVAAIAALKDALAPYVPRYREGKELVFNKAGHILFIEPRRREERMFDTIKRLVSRYKLFPCHVIEENKEMKTSSIESKNDASNSVAEIAVMNFSASQEGFSRWQEVFRTIAEGIYQEDGVSLCFNVYYRNQDGTIHAVCTDSRNAGKRVSEDTQKLGEEKWKNAVCKIAAAFGAEPQFRLVYCNSL